MVKAKNKKCGNTKCGFKKCWINAPFCEECGWDFKLQKMPKKPKEIVIDDDDDDDVEEEFVSVNVKEKPKPVTEKICPNCAHKCWHAAPWCESCEFDFITNRKKEITVQVKEEIKRAFLGVRPIFSRIPHHDWMDYKGKTESDLRQWATAFNRNLRLMFPGEHIYAESILDFVDSTKAKAMAPYKVLLYDWFSVFHRGISEWRPHPTNRLLDRGEMLTPDEQVEKNRIFVAELRNLYLQKQTEKESENIPKKIGKKGK